MNWLINLIISIIILLTCTGIYFWNFIFAKERIPFKEYFKNNINLLVLSITFCIGFFTRLLCLDLLPGGLNQDEASAGYDAFSIMKYGCDRNGNTFPVHLVAWGSGQNSLYSYIAIPFLAIFGLNEISIRLPMAIIGCISLVVFYKLLKNQFSSKIAYFGLIFLIINPWHFMKSRWGLESNIFPDLILYGTYLFIKFVQHKKIYNLIFASLILGISSYSYGTSYFFLFFFVIASLIYLLVTKKVNWKHCLISLSIIGVICIPIMIFLGINLFGGDTIKFLGITIPKLKIDRFHTTTTLFSDHFFQDAWNNLKEGLKMLIHQDDGRIYNVIPNVGYVYMFALPFMFYGLFGKDKEKNEFNWILRIWLIVSFVMMFIVKANTNRLNIIFFPIIIFTFIGLCKFINLVNKSKWVIGGYYAVSFISFLILYMGSVNIDISNKFFIGLGEAIRYASNIDQTSEIYVTQHSNMPYIYALYYTGYDVHDFIETKVYRKPYNAAFEQIESFGRYTFTIDNTYKKGSIYVVSKYDNYYMNLDKNVYSFTQFGNYYVIDEK